MSSLPTYYHVSPEEVQAVLERGDVVRLVDVREGWEYEKYHLPGALLLPLGELPGRFAAELEAEAGIICICEHGVRSRQAAAFLAAQGYSNVSTMTGGMAEYDGVVVSEPAESLL